MSATDDIMCATCRALCTQGYADLTMQDIADESSKSKAALHYHYDSKENLLVAFLDFISEQFLSSLHEAFEAAGDDPTAKLDSVLDAALSPPSGDLDGLQTALLELRAQAPHVDAFRNRIARTDEQLQSLLVDVFADGVERGAFRADIDPESLAHFTVTLLAGSYLRRVSVGQEYDTARELLERRLEQSITGGQEEPTG